MSKAKFENNSEEAGIRAVRTWVAFAFKQVYTVRTWVAFAFKQVIRDFAIPHRGT
jgi:hypothetical protein